MPLSALLVATTLELMVAPPSRPESLLIASAIQVAYSDVPAIKTAQEAAGIDDKAVLALTDRAIPLDVKLATASAYATRFAFTPFAEQYVALAYKTQLDKLKLDSLRGDELLTLGVIVSGSTGQPQERALKIFEAARKKLPQSFAAAMGVALTKASVALLKNDACAPYRFAVDVLRDGKLVLDLRQSAVDAIFDHVVGFRESCPRRGAR